jgi:hypothetical protein
MLARQRWLAPAVLVVQLACGAAASSIPIGGGPYNVDDHGVVIQLPTPYKVSSQPTWICLSVDTAHYVVDVLNGSTLRPRGAGERRSAPMTLPAPPDPSAAAVSGYVVTAAGERRKLQAGGSVLKGDQCVILSPTEPLRGEVVTAVQLAATRPVTIDSVSWFVIVH